MAVDLSNIGSILRTKREEKGISLEEVANTLCLRKSLIQAIESGTRDSLPHEVYVRSYLKEYANLLNINEQILPKLVEDNNTTGQEMKTENSQTIEEPIRRSAKFSFVHLPRKAIVYPAIVLVLTGFYVMERINRGPGSVPPAKVETTAGAPSQSQTTIENVVATEYQPAQPLSEGKKLMITCNERTWVSVVIDDAEKKEFMLNAQDMIILNAKERFDLLIGNAGGVKLILNGKDTEFSGKSGEVKRIKLS